MTTAIQASDAIDFSRYAALISRMDPILSEGEVVELVGLIVESKGPAAAIGEKSMASEA